jgi:hypothetical protein
MVRSGASFVACIDARRRPGQPSGVHCFQSAAESSPQQWHLFLFDTTKTMAETGLNSGLLPNDFDNLGRHSLY